MDAAVSRSIILDVSDWSDALRAEYAELQRARLGAPLSADALAEWLLAIERRNRAHAGDAVTDPAADAAGAGLLERSEPVPGSRVVLHAATVAARIRIEACMRDADGDREWELRLTAYCLAHAGEPSALARLALRARARTVVDRWAARELHCTYPELEAVIGRLTAGLYPPVEAAAGEARPPTGPATCTRWSSTSGAARSTGSIASAMRMRSGWRGRWRASCAGASVRLRRRLAILAQWIRTIHRCGRSANIASCGNDSGRCQA